MSKTQYVIQISLDEDAGVYYVRNSDVPGLHVEADTIDEVMAIVRDVLPDLVKHNLPDNDKRWSILGRRKVTTKVSSLEFVASA